MSSGSTRQYVSFDVDGRRYGLDIRIVKEVNPNTNITAVPRSPSHIRGLLNVRGQVVMVIDIAVVFGRPPQRTTDDSHVIILKTPQEIQRVRNLPDNLAPEKFSDRPIGFLADRISDVVTTEESGLQEVPPHLAEANARYVEGVVGIDEGLMLVLAAAELLRHRNRQI